MWTSQVYGHRDNMACTKTHKNITKHKVYKDATEIKKKLFCVFRIFFLFLFVVFYFQLLKRLLQKMLIFRLGMVNKNTWGLNQFSAAANLTLSQHFLKQKKKCPFTLFNKATKELNKTTGQSKN